MLVGAYFLTALPDVVQYGLGAIGVLLLVACLLVVAMTGDPKSAVCLGLIGVAFLPFTVAALMTAPHTLEPAPSSREALALAADTVLA